MPIDCIVNGKMALLLVKSIAKSGVLRFGCWCVGVGVGGIADECVLALVSAISLGYVWMMAA